MGKVRIGHFFEAQVLEVLGVDMIDESEVLTPAERKIISTRAVQGPVVCGARNLGEALRRSDEGAAMIRTKGEAGTGNVVGSGPAHAGNYGRYPAALHGMADQERSRRPGARGPGTSSSWKRPGKAVCPW